MTPPGMQFRVWEPVTGHKPAHRSNGLREIFRQFFPDDDLPPRAALRPRQAGVGADRQNKPWS
jgi:hypothetical protein